MAVLIGHDAADVVEPGVPRMPSTTPDMSGDEARLLRPYRALDANKAAQDAYLTTAMINSVTVGYAEGEEVFLHEAEQPESVQRLALKGAPLDGLFTVDGYDDGGQHSEVPVLTALIDGRLDVARALLDAGANPDAPNMISYGDRGAFAHTALHMMASRGDVAGARLLLDAGAEVNLPATTGLTALDYATSADHVKVVRLLLERGADHTVRDPEGTRPTDGAGARTEAIVSMSQAPAAPQKKRWWHFGDR